MMIRLARQTKMKKNIERKKTKRKIRRKAKMSKFFAKITKVLDFSKIIMFRLFVLFYRNSSDENKSEESEKDQEEGEIDDGETMHPMVSITKIDPKDIPEVSNKYLMRGERKANDDTQKKESKDDKLNDGKYDSKRRERDDRNDRKDSKG